MQMPMEIIQLLTYGEETELRLAPVGDRIEMHVGLARTAELDSVDCYDLYFY